MSIRETLNKYPGRVSGVMIAVIVLALGCVLYWETSSSGPRPLLINKLYYSADDGASYYPDMATIVPPYTNKDGKTAVRAYVFKCQGGSPFVGYLEKFTPQSKELYDSVFGPDGKPLPRPGPPSDFAATVKAQLQQGRMVKAPLTGDSGWLTQKQRGYADVLQIHPPNGGDPTTLEPVYP